MPQMHSNNSINSSKPHALFVWLKYFGGMPNSGECGWRNIIEPFSANGVGTWDAYFYDEVFAADQDKDENLLRLCREKQYDVIFHYWMPDESLWYLNIDPETLYKIRNECNIPIVSLWYDTWSPKYAEQAMGLAPLCDLTVVTDSLAHVARAARPEKFLNLCYSPNVLEFYNPGKKRDIELSHNGEINSRKDRLESLASLEKAGLPLTRHGGFGSCPLSIEAYAEVFQRSKITVNFSATPSGKRTFKARVMEATLCGAMLLEQSNPETAARFTAYQEYVPFEGADDLVEKARYYLEHDEEREAIARRGMLRAQELAKPEHFWGKILEVLKRPGLYGLEEAREGLERFINEVATNQRMRPAKQFLDKLAGKRVAVWGTGSVYRTVFADWLREVAGIFEFVGFVDNDSSRWGKELDAYPIFGPHEIPERGINALIMATYAAKSIFCQQSSLLTKVRFYN
jgi:hypothetical protein